MADWVKLITEASDSDLTEINSRISVIESELKALRAVAMVIRAKLGVKLEDSDRRTNHRKKTEIKPVTQVAPVMGSVTVKYRTDAAHHLIRVGGKSRAATICEDCDIPSGSQADVFNHPWFTRNQDGSLSITATGREEVAK